MPSYQGERPLLSARQRYASRKAAIEAARANGVAVDTDDDLDMPSGNARQRQSVREKWQQQRKKQPKPARVPGEKLVLFREHSLLPGTKVISGPSRQAYYSPYEPEPTLFQAIRERRRHGIKAMDDRLAWVGSVFSHIAIPIFGIIVLVLFSILMHIDFLKWFNPPPPKPKDIEFVLTPPEQPEKPPIDLNTQNQAEKDMQAGGVNDPTKKVEIPRPETKASQPSAAAKAAPAQKPVKAVQAPAPKPPEPKKPEPKQPPKPQPEAPPKKIPPIPKTPAPTAYRIATAPAPKKSVEPPTTKTFDVSSALKVTRGSAPSTPSAPSAASISSSGSMGNPSPGNPKGAFGIDAKRNVDTAPYMNELQKRIRMAWKPPRGNETRRVVVTFVIHRQGEITDIKIKTSSGVAVTDEAAVKAVKDISPFKPLPFDLPGNKANIEYAFDYNVFGDKRH